MNNGGIMRGGYQIISLNNIEISNNIEFTILGIYNKILNSNSKMIMLCDLNIDGEYKNSICVPVKIEANCIKFVAYDREFTINNNDIVNVVISNNIIYPGYPKLIYSYVHTENATVQPTNLDITTGIFTAENHGISEGTKVSVVMREPYNIGAPYNYLPIGLSLGTVSNTGTATSYYFRVVDENTFALSTTSNGEYLTYTLPEQFDLSKFYFEVLDAKGLNIEGLNVRDCLVVVKGRIFNAMRWIRPTNAEIFGTGLGNQMGGVGYDANFGTDSYGSCYFGRPGYNYVYGTIEFKMLSDRHIYQEVNADYVMYSDAGVATFRHNRQYYHMLLSNNKIDGIIFDNYNTGSFYNGTTIEIYAK